MGSYFLPNRPYWSSCDGTTILLRTSEWKEDTWCLSLFRYRCFHFTRVDWLPGYCSSLEKSNWTEWSYIQPGHDGATRGRRETSGTEKRCPPVKPSPRIYCNLTFPQKITEIYWALLEALIMIYKHPDRNICIANWISQGSFGLLGPRAQSQQYLMVAVSAYIKPTQVRVEKGSSLVYSGVAGAGVRENIWLNSTCPFPWIPTSGLVLGNRNKTLF